MLVDDSAVIRGALTRIIDRQPDITIISSLVNGEMAVSSARRTQPDIIILDIEMPVMDGLTALPLLLEAAPRAKVVMFSSLTEKGAAVTLKAFSLGAVECLVKPTAAQQVGEGSEFEKSILALIRGLVPRSAAQAPSPAQASAIPTPARIAKPPIALNQSPGAYRGRPDLIAIGSSTGGPQALFEVVKSFSGFAMPIVITQHMPATFTKILADHIRQQTGVPTHEGAQDMVLENGHAYVAPGGFHMLLVKKEGRTVIQLNDGPPENFCKPSVEPMLRSAIDLYGNKVLGVILTGMGNDGLGASKTLVERGGRVIAQDEETSIVWGMPGAVARAGICTAVLPLKEIGPWVKNAVAGKV